jgi:hypothetical protein
VFTIPFDGGGGCGGCGCGCGFHAGDDERFDVCFAEGSHCVAFWGRRGVKRGELVEGWVLDLPSSLALNLACLSGLLRYSVVGGGPWRLRSAAPMI